MESNWSLRNRLIRENPEMSNKDIAAATGYSVAYIGQVRRDKAYEEAAIQRRADKEQQKLDDYAAAAVAAEREECAKMLEEYAKFFVGRARAMPLQHCAKLIRARGEK